MDETACNYNSTATDSDDCFFTDGVCETCSGEQDGTGTIVDNDSDNDGLCNVLDVVSGCTDASACNYNSSSTINSDNSICILTDGVCESCSGEQDGTGTIVDNDSDNDGVCNTLEVVGCIDETACNYNTAATDAADCVYSADLDACASCSGEQDGTGTVVDNDTDNDGLCNALEVLGCTNASACNYNSAATDSDVCIYSSDLDDCASCSGEQDGTGTVVDNDTDNDGLCNALEILGCTNASACNYNSAATDSDLCIYSTDLDDCATCSGETDGTGTIVDNDTDNDGVCLLDEIEGCTLVWADNFLENATDSNDQLCVREGCMVVNMFNYDSLATFDSGGCIQFIYGCTDVSANNYNLEANTQGTSVCFYEGCMDSLYQNYNPIANIQSACIYSGCTNPESFNYEEIANQDDSSCYDIVIGCMDSLAQNYNQLANTASSCEFVGCMDSLADNFLEYANINDVCYFYGCMNEYACNYSEQANVQLSNFCEFPQQNYDCDSVCLFDSDNDGVCNEFEIFGCVDELSANYNPLATQDDNSCYQALQIEQVIVQDASCKGGFGSIQLSISGGLQPITIGSYTTYQSNKFVELSQNTITIDSILSNTQTEVLTYNIHVYDSNGDGVWYPYTISQPSVSFEMSLEYDPDDSELSFDTNTDNFDLEWYFENQLLIDETNSVITPESNGLFGLRLIDEFGCSILEEIRIVDLSIQEEHSHILKIFPNPANDLFTISSNLLLEPNSQIKLFDLSGSLVYSESLENYQLDFQIIDVSSISKGTYIVYVGNGISELYSRLVIR